MVVVAAAVAEGHASRGGGCASARVGWRRWWWQWRPAGGGRGGCGLFCFRKNIFAESHLGSTFTERA
jgi:hypothetical protein